MKRILTALMLMCLFLVGCNTSQTEAPQTKEANSASISDEEIQSEQSGETPTVDYDTQIKTLQKKVADAVTKAEGLKGTDKKIGTQMLMELENVSNELDLLEDEIEWEAKNGQMSVYRAHLKQLNQMENTLDGAENLVEQQFSIDD